MENTMERARICKQLLTISLDVICIHIHQNAENGLIAFGEIDIQCILLLIKPTYTFTLYQP